MKNISKEKIMDYVEGKLEEPERMAIEKALKKNPELAQEVILLQQIVVPKPSKKIPKTKKSQTTPLIIFLALLGIILIYLLSA